MGAVLSSFSMTTTRIFVVAGPRSCGKTTFIERCGQAAAHRFLPSVLSGITSARGPIHFMDLANLASPISTDLLVHVDLVTPFAELLTHSEQELQERLQPSAFAEYPGASLFRECPELKVLTLRAPRILTLRRWLRRCAAQGRVTVPTVMTQLYSDASGEAAYAALFDAWDRYVAALPNAEAWDVFETADGVGYAVVRH